MNGIDNLRKELYELDEMGVEDFQRIRNARFAGLVLHHFRNNEPYRKLLLKKSGIKSEDQLPKTISEIGILPTTEREWFEEARIHDNPSVSKDKIKKNIETSGSTGKPFLIPYSHRASMETGGKLFARAMIMAGIDTNNPCYIVTHWIPEKEGVPGKDIWASHEIMPLYKELGGNLIDESTQTPLLQHMDNIIESGAESTVSGTPLYNALAGVVMSKGLTDKIKLKTVFASGGGVLDVDRAFVKKALGLDKYLLFYATSEAMISATQMEEGGPYYAFADTHAIEIVDEDLNPVKEGEKGKILLTPFDMDSAPVVRYIIGDEVRYVGVGPHEGHSKFVPVFDSIRRFKDAAMGGGLLALSQIEEFPKYMREKGMVAMGIQVAKQREGMKDKPVIRLEVPPGQDPDKIEEAAIYAFRKNDQMAYLIDSGEIRPPGVEIYKPGELRGNRLKPTLFIDETGG